MSELSGCEGAQRDQVLEGAELDLLHPELPGARRALILPCQLDQMQQPGEGRLGVWLRLTYWLWTHWPSSPSIRAVRREERFGQNLRRLRTAAGLSQEQLAERSGIHPTAVSRIERAVRDPRLKTILRLAKAVGVEPARLFDGIR